MNRPTPTQAHGTDVLILTTSTGAGHDRVAVALREAAHELAPAVGVRILDPLAGGAKNGSLSAGRWYDATVARAPWLWGLFYHATNNAWAIRLGLAAGALLWAHRLRGVLQTERPRLVVSVHPVCTRLVADILRTIPAAPPLHCVVTDLVTIHRCWACAAVDAFYVATAEARDALTAMGIPRERIHMTGLPLRASFARTPHAPAESAAPRVLVLGGGRPSRRFEKVVRALVTALPRLRVVVVCGHNTRLRRRLTRAVGAGATVLGWRDDIAALMQWSSVIITKGGSVTLAEALSQARPLLIYQVLPGQEDGNVMLAARTRRGRYIRDLDALVHAVAATACAWSASNTEQAMWWGGAAKRVAAHLLAARVDETGATRRPGCLHYPE